MGHKVKVRVTLSSGKTEKIGFSLEEGKIFRLNGEVPGMAVLAALVGDPEATVVRMSIKNGALVITKSSKGPELVVNNQTVEEAKIRKGDILTYANGKIEFLDAPVWIEQEAATKVINLNDLNSDATSVMQNPNATKFINAPATLGRAAEAENIDPYAQGSGYSEVQAEEVPHASVPNPSSHVIGTMSIPEPSHNHEPANEHRVARSSSSSDGATAFIMAARGPDGQMRRGGPIAQPATSYGDESPQSPWKSIAMSVAMIGFCGEVASLIGFGFKYTYSPIPTPFSGLALVAVFSAVSALFYYANRMWGTTGKFENYLRSFGWFSIYLLPFSFAFGFPKSVLIMASVLLGGVWIGMFALKYFGHLPKFIPASAITWVVLIFVGFHTLAGRDFQTIKDDSNREVASNAPAEAPTQTPAVAPVAVATIAPAPAATASANDQQITQQANSLNLDPMAQEQFFNAVKSGNYNMVVSMVERHVIDPVFTMDHGSSALHYAASQGDLRLVKYLVSKRVNIDAQDAGGTTPLMWATYKQRPKVVAYLLFRKANPQIRREGGDRALEIARSTDNTEIVTMLKAAMKAPARRVASVKKRHHHSKSQ
jgi:hypothetical protein